MMLAEAASEAAGADAALAAALAVDLDANFEAFVLAYQDAIVGFVHRMLGTSSPGALDVAQETFVRAYRALRRYDAGRTAALRLRPWLYRIAANLTRNAIRTRGRSAQPHGGELPDAADPGPQPAQIAADRLRDRALYAAVARLPASRRIPLVLRYFQDLSYEDVAAAIGTTPGAARVAVHRALAALRTELTAERIDP